MTATAADYTWFDERFPGLSDAYCITLVRGLSPAEVLDRLEADLDIDERRITGAERLVGPAYEAWEEYLGDAFFLGATAIGDWTLVIEPNGWLGTTVERSGPLSTGTRLVSHFRNINAVHRFYWIEDGDVRLTFEPLFPSKRSGSDPDGLVDVMKQVGFDLGEGDDRSNVSPASAAFALAEYLTEVKLTPGLLEGTTFECGVADA